MYAANRICNIQDSQGQILAFAVPDSGLGFQVKILKAF